MTIYLIVSYLTNGVLGAYVSYVDALEYCESLKMADIAASVISTNLVGLETV